MTREAWGDAGDQGLFAWVEDEAAASQCGDPANLSADITSVSPDPVTVGQPLTIQVTYTNDGPATAYGTSVHIGLSPGAAGQTATADQGTCSVTATGDVDCYLGAVAPGSGSIQIDALAMSPGEHSILAHITAHVEDTDPSDDSDTRIFNAVESLATIR